MRGEPNARLASGDVSFRRQSQDDVGFSAPRVFQCLHRRVASCRPRNIAYRLTFSVFYLYPANVIVPPTIAARRRPRISSRAARKRAGMSNSVGGRGFLAVPSRGHARLNHETTVIPLPLPLAIFLPRVFQDSLPTFPINGASLLLSRVDADGPAPRARRKTGRNKSLVS